MNGKKAIRKSSRNHPVKKSIRLVKNRIAALNLSEQQRRDEKNGLYGGLEDVAN